MFIEQCDAFYVAIFLVKRHELKILISECLHFGRIQKTMVCGEVSAFFKSAPVFGMESIKLAIILEQSFKDLFLPPMKNVGF